jgi:hypothetical protein
VTYFKKCMWLRRLFAVEVNLERRHFGARFLNTKHMKYCMCRKYINICLFLLYLITEALVNNNYGMQKRKFREAFSNTPLSECEIRLKSKLFEKKINLNILDPDPDQNNQYLWM